MTAFILDMPRSMVELKWVLNDFMRIHSISNRELAKALDKHEGSISRLKRAEGMPQLSGEELKLICNALTSILKDRDNKLKRSVVLSDILECREIPD